MPARRHVSGLLALALLLWTGARVASGGPPPADGVPPGTVAFFDGVNGCPPGWTPAAFANGRLVVGASPDGGAGQAVGVPLADQEDRPHAHALSGSISLSGNAIIALDGNNNSGAAAGTVNVAGVTDAGSTGLPFVQLIACERP